MSFHKSILIVFIFLTSISLIAKPPGHAKAYGNRGGYVYIYYPDFNMYFHPAKGVYFFLKGGKWISGPRPPVSLFKLKGAGGVKLELDTLAPYRLNREHRIKFKLKGPGKLLKPFNGGKKGKIR